MAYLALYRRFRPSTLDDVVRQEHIVTVLKNQIETEKVGHAYLFCGPRGTGKTSVAKIFAAAINCEHPVNGSPCGKCATCRALADPSNLDISEIDAASNNGVDEMRDLREKVQYPPVAGKYKVYIVDEVHMLSTGAFNALLKTLEEPPAHAVFILATTEAQKIPATILSRCMRFDFKLIPQADLEERLKKILKEIGKPYEDEAVSSIARAGAGSVRDMLSLADTCISYSTGTLTYAAVTEVLGSADFEVTAELCKAMLSGDTGEALEKTETLLSDGKSVGMLLKDVLNFLNACAVAAVCKEGNKLLSLPQEMYSKVAEIARSCGGHRLLRTTEIFAETESSLRYSVSPRILFETAVFKASMPEADQDTEALLARIEELEKKISTGDFVARQIPAPSVSDKNVAYNETKSEEPSRDEPIEEEYVPYDETPPPDEDETGGNVYFDGGFLPKKPTAKQAEKAEKAEQAAQVEQTSFAPAPAPAPAPQPKAKAAPVATGDAKATFGLFLRTLRKTGKNGVLFTICMDLDSAYEGDKFVLYTESDTMYRSLVRPEHYALITQVFAAMGVSADGFEIKLRGKKSDDLERNLNELKDTFSGVKIDVK